MFYICTNKNKQHLNLDIMATTKKLRLRPNGLNETISIPEYKIDVFYSTERKSAIMYHTKRNATYFAHRFHTVEQMMQHIKESVEYVSKREQDELDRLSAIAEISTKKDAFDYFKVGDIVTNEWGWEQTNVNFFQVIKITKKRIVVKEINKIVAEVTGDMSNTLLPVAGEFKTLNGYEFTLSVQPVSETEASLKGGEKYYNFSKFDGKPVRASYYA